MNNQTLNEINKRDLDKCYFSLSFSYSTIYFNDGNDYIYQRKVYTLIGCNIFGVRKYITSIFEDDFEKASDWYNFFQTLKSRGLESVIFSVLPNVDFIRKAIKLSFPETTIFTSCFDIVDRLFKFFSYSYSTNIYESIKHIFLAKDTNEFKLNVNDFYTDFQVQPFIIEIVSNHFKRISFDIDYILRKHIYSFYFNRDLYKRLAVISHSKPYFFDISSFEEELIPNIKSMESKMYCPKCEWNSVINLIYNLNKDLIMRYL